VALNRRVFGTEHSEVAITLNNLALVSRDKGDYAAANALFAEVHDMDREFLRGRRLTPTQHAAAERGVALCEAWGKTQPAAEWQEKATAK